mmetsp:Transcript_33055/g.87737  ORF Transcript_33055/g.87737 Transcript_33055/m.87737 type:complete len:95 (+) Transcript_33055:304-588(+)
MQRIETGSSRQCCKGADGAQPCASRRAIASLKNEIERAWKLADAFQERARRADEAAGELEAQVARLSRLMERRAGASLDYIMYKFIGCSLLLTA